LGTGHDIGRRVALLGLRFTLFCFYFVPSPFVRRFLIFENFERLISDSARGSWLLRGRFSEALYFFFLVILLDPLSLSLSLSSCLGPSLRREAFSNTLRLRYTVVGDELLRGIFPADGWTVAGRI